MPDSLSLVPFCLFLILVSKSVARPQRLGHNPRREAGDFCSPVWNLRAVIWFPFPISSLLFLFFFFFFFSLLFSSCFSACSFWLVIFSAKGPFSWLFFFSPENSQIAFVNCVSMSRSNALCPDLKKKKKEEEKNKKKTWHNKWYLPSRSLCRVTVARSKWRTAWFDMPSVQRTPSARTTRQCSAAKAARWLFFPFPPRQVHEGPSAAVLSPAVDEFYRGHVSGIQPVRPQRAPPRHFRGTKYSF